MSEFFKTLAHGDKKIESATFKAGYKTTWYNRERNTVETLLVEKDCIVDEQWVWCTEDKRWKFDETLWNTARDIPPPPPTPPKPPGFWAKLWAKLTRKAVLPTARLLKD